MKPGFMRAPNVHVGTVEKIDSLLWLGLHGAIHAHCESGRRIDIAALDVTVEARILDLMRDLQSEYEMSIMLISHNLGVIAEMCDRVMVMYLGKVIEEGSVTDIFDNPRHPCTRGLLASIPHIGLSARLTPIEGAAPMMQDLPPGCPPCHASV